MAQKGAAELIFRGRREQKAALPPCTYDLGIRPRAAGPNGASIHEEGGTAGWPTIHYAVLSCLWACRACFAVTHKEAPSNTGSHTDKE